MAELERLVGQILFNAVQLRGLQDYVIRAATIQEARRLAEQAVPLVAVIVSATHEAAKHLADERADGKR